MNRDPRSTSCSDRALKSNYICRCRSFFSLYLPSMLLYYNSHARRNLHEQFSLVNGLVIASLMSSLESQHASTLFFLASSPALKRNGVRSCDDFLAMITYESLFGKCRNLLLAQIVIFIQWPTEFDKHQRRVDGAWTRFWSLPSPSCLCPNGQAVWIGCGRISAV